VARADEQGRVMLKDTPIGLYRVEVTGNDEYQPAKREVNIVNDEDKDEIIIYIAMKPRAESSIEFKLVSNAHNSSQDIPLKTDGVNVKAILLPNLPT
jgi:hypothetical protein